MRKVRGIFMARLYTFLFKWEVRFEAYLDKRRYGRIMNPMLEIEYEYCRKL